MKIARCIYCGRHAGCTDHIVPPSKGGSEDVTNRVPCCTPCNASKRNRPVEIFLRGHPHILARVRAYQAGDTTVLDKLRPSRPPRSRGSESDGTVISLAIRLSLVKQIDAIAAGEHRSRAAQINAFLEHAVRAYQAPDVRSAA
jgi:hypothetical protein